MSDWRALDDQALYLELESRLNRIGGNTPLGDAHRLTATRTDLEVDVYIDDVMARLRKDPAVELRRAMLALGSEVLKPIERAVGWLNRRSGPNARRRRH